MLGHGAFGKVRLDSAGRALKYVDLNNGTLAFHEARILRAVRGVSGVPRLHRVEKRADCVVLTMDYRGVELKKGQCTPSRLLREVGRTLDRIHALGIVHRDIKPANILLHPVHGLTLCDFGLATDASKVPLFSRAGTCGWRPPPLLSPKARDVWQLLLVAKWLCDSWCYSKCAADLGSGSSPCAALTDKYAFWASMSSERT